MREVILCPDIVNQGANNEVNVASFNNGDTFKLTYHFYSNLGNRSLELDQFDFIANYYIYGYESEVISYTKTNISNDQVLIDNRNCIIKFLFRDYRLRNGKLFFDCELRYRDWNFNGTWAVDKSSGFTGITLI